MNHAVAAVLILAVGVLIGWALPHFGTRQPGNAVQEARRLFGEVEEMMPELLAAMRTGLAKPQHLRTRTFLMWPSRRENLVDEPQNVLVFYENEHPRLRSHVAWLRELGFVQAAPASEELYRMSEVFVALLWETGDWSAPGRSST